MQDAMASGDEHIVVLLMQRMKGVVENRFEERIPIAVQALQEVILFELLTSISSLSLPPFLHVGWRSSCQAATFCYLLSVAETKA